MNYTLNGVAIASPEGIDGLTLTRSRHRNFWGFFHQGKSVVTGLTNLRFSDAAAIRILEAGFREMAGVTVFAISGQGFNYEAKIDYDTYERSLDGVTVGLRDAGIADMLAKLANTVFELPLEELFPVGAISLGDPIALKVSRGAGQTVMPRSGISGIPFDTTGDASQPNVIYKNTSAAPVRLRIKGRVEATFGSNSLYQLTAGNQRLFDLGNVPKTSVSGLIDRRCTVAPGDSVTLTVFLGGGSTPITYSTATTLTLTEEPESVTSPAVGISLSSALRKLLAHMGLSSVGLTGDWLERYSANKITTAAGLTGASNATIQLSLGSVLANLTLLHCLKTGITVDKQLRIERRGNPEGVSQIGYKAIQSLSIRRATDFVYGSVTAGWAAPSDTTQRLRPAYQQRTTITGLVSAGELRLTPDWICDPDRIEQARRGLLSQNADKTNEVYYLRATNDNLSAVGLLTNWQDHYKYSQLPELHPLSLTTTQVNYTNLSDRVAYEGPNGNVEGDVLDVSYREKDNTMTLTLLVQ